MFAALQAKLLNQHTKITKYVIIKGLVYFFRTQNGLNSMGWGDRVWVTEEANAGGTFSRPPPAVVPDREKRSTASRMAAPADHPRIPLYFQPQLQTENQNIQQSEHF